jgi:hypothetical protein
MNRLNYKNSRFIIKNLIFNIKNMKILDNQNKYRELYIKNFINIESEYFKNNLSSSYLEEYV